MPGEVEWQVEHRRLGSFMIDVRSKFILAILATVLVFSSTATGQSFDADTVREGHPTRKGLDAYQRGDYAEAEREWRALAERGHAEAQTRLGYMYFYGDDVVPVNRAEAVRLWRLAAEQGYVQAQMALGHRAKRGQILPRDGHEAARWYRLAAEQGHVNAMFELGLLYATGVQLRLPQFGPSDRGLAKDYAEAARWYRMAAEQGHAMAQTLLGSSYAKGRGVPQDYVLAHKWSNLGAANGGFGAAVDRDDVASRMTTAQIAEAQRLAREWSARRR